MKKTNEENTRRVKIDGILVQILCFSDNVASIKVRSSTENEEDIYAVKMS